MEELKKKLYESVEKNIGEAVLLSGGVDSSIIAYLASRKHKLTGITVSFESYGDDTKYAKILADFLGIETYTRSIAFHEAIETIPEIITIIRSFDPAIPNDLATYFGLKLAKEKGFRSIMTGDGGDELFAGYSYMQDLDLKSYLPRLWKTMQFSSITIGKYVGIDVKQPYLAEEFKNYAMSIEPELKIKKVNGKVWGKWILRKSFEKELPDCIIWRKKTPIEIGSGFSALREKISSMISDHEFETSSKKLPIKFMNKEHLYYYKIYRDLVGKIPPPKTGEDKCNGCGAGLPKNSLHCYICGRFPAISD